ncbi:MAG: PqqD family protein [Eubacterium sp.]|nr:PqqD family protein [Eubacterium sp.]
MPKDNKNFLDYIYKVAEGKKFTTNEKTGIVTIKVENKGFYNRIAQKFFHKPKYSFIDLDQYGSTLWLLLDGKKDVAALVKEMKEEFPKEADTMQDRVIRFIATLVHNDYIEKC